MDLNPNPILLVIKAKSGCGACNHINTFWHDVVKKIREDELLSDMKIIVMNIEKLGDPMDMKSYPKSILKIATYLPTFAMLKSGPWAEAMKLINLNVGDEIIDVTEGCEILGYNLINDVLIRDTNSKYSYMSPFNVMNAKIDTGEIKTFYSLFDWIASSYVNVKMGYVPCFEDTSDGAACDKCNNNVNVKANIKTNVNNDNELTLEM